MPVSRDSHCDVPGEQTKCQAMLDIPIVPCMKYYLFLKETTVQ